MQHVYNIQAQKRAANLSINSDLLNQAKVLKINLSATLEQSLAEELRKRKEVSWRTENKQAIDEYNQRIDKRGLFSDGLRVF
ncbi:MAG: type II toxin-antitoxin system CcdA family antitoxin [Mariprofundaceae bacterium]|nr:type II toxin-antitoxin system CcdA family antitoxin [Mariprofundaceae bacterium]